MNSPFDERAYKRLLKGLEISEVLLSKVFSDMRIDAETYQPFYQDIENTIKKHSYCSLGSICSTLKKGIFDIKAEVYSDKGIPFVRITNLRNMGISTNDLIHIPESENLKNIDTYLEKGDIILSKTAIPAASIVQIDCCNTSQDTIAVKVSDKYFKNSFIVVFLNCKYGYYQMKKWFTGNIQMHLNLTDCKNILIPKLSINFQKHLDKIFWRSFEKLDRSQSLYREAEALLLEHIGLAGWTPGEENIAVKMFSESVGRKASALATGRLDAEFYQKKYEEIIDIVKTYKNGFSTLDKFIESYSTGYPYKSETYLENNGIPLIRINNITKEGVDLSNAIHIPKEDLNLSTKDITKENDILISMSGTIGLSCVVKEKQSMAVNQRIMKISAKNYNPYVLSMLINSIVGKYQLERIGTGGVQTNISSPDIKSILIPLIAAEVQARIAALIQESFALRRESEGLLDEAKAAVEREIGGVK